MQQSNRLLGFVQRRWKLLLVFAILLWVVYFIATHGFISVTVSGASTGETNYSLLNQSATKSNQTKSTNNTITKFVSKGSYEVTTTNKDKSAFAVVKVGGFLSKKTVNMALVAEKNRSFVGDNPASCAYLVNGTLYSYYCSDIYSNLVKHVPASAHQPTYTAKNTNTSLAGTIEGTASVDGNTLLLLKAAPVEGSSSSLHTLYQAGDNFSLTNGIALGNLDNNKQYSIEAYKEGFLAYDSTFSSVFYYPSASATPQAIILPSSTDKSLGKASSGASNNGIVVAYANKRDFNSYDNPNRTIGKVHSEFIVYQEGTIKKVALDQTLKNAFTSAQVCAKNKLCLIGDSTLFVYDISAAKPSLDFKVTGVSSMTVGFTSVLVARSGELLNLDVNTATGYNEYSFGGFTYCGIQKTQSGYLLCVSNKSGKGRMLLLSDTGDDSDGIDQKIAVLEQSQDIKAVSIYQNFIYISPNITGKYVYIPSIKSYDYDPVTKKKVNDSINSEIDKLRIDRTKYIIINTAGS